MNPSPISTLSTGRISIPNNVSPAARPVTVTGLEVVPGLVELKVTRAPEVVNPTILTGGSGVGVLVAVLVAVGVDVFIGVFVGVLVGVVVKGVIVIVGVGVFVGVLVGVAVVTVV